MDLILKATTPEEKHAAIWCVQNLVPLRQNVDRKLTIVFYEDLVSRCADELERVFGAMRLEFSRNVLRRVGTPSSTSSPSSAIRTGRDLIGGWRREIDPSQAQRVLDFVEAFGMDFLYGDSMTPVHSPVDSDLFARKGT